MKYQKDWFCDNIRNLQDGMYRFAYSIVKNEDDVQDVIQETIYKSFKNLENLKDKKKFKSWIYKILSNTALEMLKKQENFLDIDENISIQDNTKNIDTNLTLWNAVQKLEQPYRSVIVLFYYEDMSIKEISAITGTKNDTVKKQLSRGREKLKNRIQGKEVID